MFKQILEYGEVVGGGRMTSKGDSSLSVPFLTVLSIL